MSYLHRNSIGTSYLRSATLIHSDVQRIRISGRLLCVCDTVFIPDLGFQGTSPSRRSGKFIVKNAFSTFFQKLTLSFIHSHCRTIRGFLFSYLIMSRKSGKKKPIKSSQPLSQYIRDELQMTCALKAYSDLNSGKLCRLPDRYEFMQKFYHGKVPSRPPQIKLLGRRAP